MSERRHSFPADPRVEPLLRRGVFPMVKTGPHFVIPYGEGARRGLVQSGEYPPDFLPFLERMLAALARPAFAPGSHYPGGWYRLLRARGEDPAAAEPTPEAMAAFYRDSLRVDGRGRWWAGERAITGRVLRFFLKHLEYDETLGLYRVRYPLDQIEECQYLLTESPPLRGERLETGGGAPRLRLNDGSVEPLRPETLWMDGRERLYCTVKAQGLTAAIDDPARWEILGTLEEADGRWFVTVAGHRREIPLRES